MALPSDILLPADAKYYAFVDEKLVYNPHWDINWSFTYALSGSNAGFCTFLTNIIPSAGWPGHYLGYSGNLNLSAYIIGDDGEYILTELGQRLLLESANLGDEFLITNLSEEIITDLSEEIIIGTGEITNNGILAIGFDSTGLFALSSSTRGGVGLGSIRQNSLIIRDAFDDVIVNVQLSAISSEFILLSDGGNVYQTLRFRYSQAGNKLSIDFKTPTDTNFKLLTSIVTELVIPQNYSDVYVGFSYCSPISSLSASPATMRLRNFHTQGNSAIENYENTTFVPITASGLVGFTTLSSLTAKL